MGFLSNLLPIGPVLQLASKVLRPGGGEEGRGFAAMLKEQLGQGLVKRWDTDGDGAVSLGEFSGSEAAFRSLDRDGNGSLKVAELEFGLTQAAHKLRLESALKRYMALYDADQNRLITQRESGLQPAAFEGLDTNSDGVLVREELLRGFPPRPILGQGRA